MMQLKPVSLLDPHATRNQCKLIWDSASGSRLTTSTKHRVGSSGKKVGFSVGPLKSAKVETNTSKKVRFTEARTEEVIDRDLERKNSIVAQRISFFEDKGEVTPDSDTDLKVKISFDDHATTTFEYDHEDTALEKYLQEHPEEREEAMQQEEEVNGDIKTTIQDLLNDSPRIPEPEPTMKSNTVLGTSGGGFTSYKSKIQTQDFQFGMRVEPEMEEEDKEEPEPEEAVEQLDLLPAGDTETETFSAELDKADMLF